MSRKETRLFYSANLYRDGDIYRVCHGCLTITDYNPYDEKFQEMITGTVRDRNTTPDDDDDTIVHILSLSVL
jgi:hypothetical protein